LQQFVSERMNAPLYEVSIGFYQFDSANYDSETYSPHDITAAAAEALSANMR